MGALAVRPREPPTGLRVDHGCRRPDVQVDAFRSSPLEGGPYTSVADPYSAQCVRERVGRDRGITWRRWDSRWHHQRRARVTRCSGNVTSLHLPQTAGGAAMMPTGRRFCTQPVLQPEWEWMGHACKACHGRPRRGSPFSLADSSNWHDGLADAVLSLNQVMRSVAIALRSASRSDGSHGHDQVSECVSDAECSD